MTDQSEFTVELAMTIDEAWLVYDLLAARTTQLEVAENAILGGLGSDKFRPLRNRLRAQIPQGERHG